MTRPSEAARFLSAEALAALGRLRAAWPWLAEARIPGPEAPTAGPPDRREHSERVRREQAAKDRAARIRALSGGAGPHVATRLGTRGHPSAPIGPHADAARVAPIAARAEVADLVIRLADRLDQFTRGAGDRRILWPVVVDTVVRGPGDCRTCAGTGEAPRPAWWPTTDPWPPASGPEDAGGVPVPCTACAGAGRTRKATALDPSDALVAAALTLIANLLPGLRNADVAGDAARTLDRADRIARRGSRAGEHKVHIKAPCPACQARDLWAEVSSPKREEWVIRCESRLCACRGPGCPCGRPVRYKGRRHLWPALEWGGPRGLAHRLGVDLPTDRRSP